MTEMRRVVLYRDNAGEWRWRKVAANGNIIADSGEGYEHRTDARKMAEAELQPGDVLDEGDEEESA